MILRSYINKHGFVPGLILNGKTYAQRKVHKSFFKRKGEHYGVFQQEEGGYFKGTGC